MPTDWKKTLLSSLRVIGNNPAALYATVDECKNVAVRMEESCSNFPLQRRQQSSRFDLCYPSAPCCDIQTELPIISLAHLWLRHESRLTGGSGPLGRRADGMAALLDMRRSATVATAPLLPQPGGCLAAELQTSGPLLVWSEAERGRL